MVRRLLSIWFPRLASEASLRRRPVDGPFALVLRAGNADHLHCLNPAAMAQGLHRGMGLADARAICPDLTTRPADLAREAAALEALRRWSARYAPMVAADGSDGVMADISGVAHLFGGEAELRDDLQARLARAGITGTSAIAGSRGAAHALARHGGGVIREGRLAEGLGPLPVAALRLDPATAAGLARLGLSHIRDLLPLPRAPLAKRFGPGLVLRLDQALGIQAEPVAPAPAPPHFGVRMTLPDPIGLHSDVMAGLVRLLERLCAQLAQAHRGARRVRLELRRVDRGTAQAEIGLARPMRDPARIAALFAKGLEEIDAGFGIDALRLSAPVTEPLAPEQTGAAAIWQAGGQGEGQQTDALADLVSRLGNRIGFDHVLRFLPAESKIPERSFLLLPVSLTPAGVTPERGPCFAEATPPRPAILFPPEPVAPAPGRPGRPPEHFVWRRMRLTTVRAAGPERIAPEWWFDDPAWRSGLRDYWRVETREGPRLWLFHTPASPGWPMRPGGQREALAMGGAEGAVPSGAQDAAPVAAAQKDSRLAGGQSWFVQGEFV